jgi:hypothetical protein
MLASRPAKPSLRPPLNDQTHVKKTKIHPPKNTSGPMPPSVAHRSTPTKIADNTAPPMTDAHVLKVDPKGRPPAELDADLVMSPSITNTSIAIGMLRPMFGKDINPDLGLYLAGGRIQSISDTLRPQAELWAKARGCGVSVLSGRRGWARVWRRHGYQQAGRTDHPFSWTAFKILTKSVADGAVVV